MVQLAVSVLRLNRRWGWGPAALALLALLNGCALPPAPAADEVLKQALPAHTRVPDAWSAAAAAAAVSNGWLKSFEDPALETIVAEALDYNLDLRQAAQQVLIAQQDVVVAGAALLPQVGAQLGGREVRDSSLHNGANSTVAYVGVSWELDVWGRLRAERDAARANYQASELDFAWARQSLAATVAKAWYLAIETRQLVALSQRAVGVYTELLKLTQARRDAGKDSDLDVFDTRAQLESAQSTLLRNQQADGEVRRALEVLVGRYPAAELATAAAYPQLPAAPGAGLPAQLIERRPDLLAAQQEVLVAFNLQQAAQLRLLPDFSLTLVGGRLGDTALALLGLNPWLVSAAVGMSIPLYEGGALQAKVDIATARQALVVARYGATLLTAFREVEDSLANDRLLAQRLLIDQRGMQDRSSAVKVATTQYLAGRRDLLWVSQLQAEQLLAESALIQLRGAQGANRIRLYLALGGGFDATPAAAITPAVAATP